MMLSSMRMNILPLLLLLVVLAQTASVVKAQCDATTCTDCLAGFNCVWMKDGTCSEQCGNFPNTDCYNMRMFSGNDNLPISNQDICDAAADPAQVAEHETCFTNTNSIACLNVDGCGWFRGNVASTGTDAGWCSLDLSFVDAPEPCSATTCDACLTDTECVWSTAASVNGTCTKSCDNFPNVDCYYPRLFGPAKASDICVVATTRVADQERCFNQTTQDSCLAEGDCSWLLGNEAASENSTSTGWCVVYLESAGAPTVSRAVPRYYHSSSYVWYYAVVAMVPTLFLVAVSHLFLE